MIKYYPLTRIKTNLYTRGGEFLLPDGRSYTGRYYLTFDNKAYTGVNPILGTNQPLRRLPEDPFILSEIPTISYEYDLIDRNKKRDSIDNDTELEALKPYFPVPLESDYARGYFTRYFAKQLTGPGFIFEISETDWAGLENGVPPQSLLVYEVTSLFWQLTGPLNNKRVSQYQIQGGVFDTNKRVTESKEKTFRGIVSYIGGDYTKFARITP